MDRFLSASGTCSEPSIWPIQSKKKLPSLFLDCPLYSAKQFLYFCFLDHSNLHPRGRISLINCMKARKSKAKQEKPRGERFVVWGKLGRILFTRCLGRYGGSKPKLSERTLGWFTECHAVSFLVFIFHVRLILAFIRSCIVLSNAAVSSVCGL